MGHSLLSKVPDARGAKMQISCLQTLSYSLKVAAAHVA